MPSRERVYRTEAIVLRRQDFGEADRLTTVYSPQYGKLRLVAKGVRRIHSRKAGHLEPFTRATLMIAQGRDLDLITQAEAIETYPQIRADLIRLSQASYLLELLDRFTIEEGEGNRALYQLLLATLERLALGKDEPAASIFYFELRLLDLVGYRPELNRCVECGNPTQPQDQFFSYQQGGVLCPQCGVERRGLQPISLMALKLMRYYQRSDFAAASAPRIPSTLFSEVESLMEGYISYLLEQRLRVPAFLRKIGHMKGQDAEEVTD
jgi:DNA repair protein RecO (recombination protein O)